ncbi:MAG: hypothetical protein HC921_03475 [Synechococcaceae cyanobacterium SM2_3_1]|nr:hypothetical protein [Synechococcaceae cyanobacterium SM2_3_1]
MKKEEFLTVVKQLLAGLDPQRDRDALIGMVLVVGQLAQDLDGDDVVVLQIPRQ